MKDELTNAEREFIATLPGPPEMAVIQTSNVWIVEWLSADEPHTGRTLHNWMKDRRQGWSAYFFCQSKTEVIAAIAKAAELAQRSEMRPVLHLESHGGDLGLEGPDGNGSTELLTWDELAESLRQLNLATRCNLVVVVAACTGFAGVQALQCGSRAPAVALVGPDAPVMPRNLLMGTKEFYRRWLDENPSLADIAESASHEADTVAFEWEPFAILVYDALVESLMKSMRPAERLERTERIRQRMLAENRFSAPEIEARLLLMPPLPPWEGLQQAWDEMFMMDLDPRNRERFGLDLRTIVDRIIASK
jgi:hypothetical protein